MEVAMIHITLTSAKPSPANDPLGRTRYGYSPEMTPQEIYESNHGYYILGARADRERYAIFSAPDKPRPNKVVLAVEIDRIDCVHGKPGHRQIVGQFLTKGHPVFDAYVGKPSPVIGVRNPVSYIDADEDLRHCECGCGAEVSRGPFVSGHDQRALHERVAKIGTVAEFLRWFDQAYLGHGEVVSAAVPELRHGQPQAFRRGGWNLDKYKWPDGLELSIYDDGRVKIGQWDSSVAIHDVSNFAAGKSRSSAHVVALFTPDGTQTVRA
jgi:hypothetical protein